MIDLTIIIPNHNNFDTLDRLLHSIGQNESIEIIVIDDHSSKYEYNVLNLKKKYENVKFLENTKNYKSAGACRNIGIQHSNGNYLLFADSDDYFTDDYLKIIYKFLSDEYDIVYFSPISVVEKTMEVGKRHRHYKALIEKSLQISNLNKLKFEFIVPWSKLYKRSFIIYNNIFFDEVIASNDVMFSVYSAFFAREIHLSTDTIYVATERNGSLTRTFSLEIYRSRISVFTRYYNFLRSRLETTQFLEVNLRPAGYIKQAIKKFGLKEMINTINLFRDRNVSLLKNKKHKPIIIEMIGIPGSGKSTIVNMLSASPIGKKYNIITREDIIKKRARIVYYLSFLNPLRWKVMKTIRKLIKINEPVSKLYHIKLHSLIYGIKKIKCNRPSILLLDEGLIQHLSSFGFMETLRINKDIIKNILDTYKSNEVYFIKVECDRQLAANRILQRTKSNDRYYDSSDLIQRLIIKENSLLRLETELDKNTVIKISSLTPIEDMIQKIIKKAKI